MNRRGMALGLVLWAIVIGSAVLAVAVFIGALERRAAGTGRHLERAMTRAETRLSDALVGWSPGLLGRRLLHPFDSLVVGNLDPSWRGVIRRLNRGLFLVSVQAEDPSSSSMATVATLSRLGWILRVRPIVLAPIAAFRTGSAVLGVGSKLSGRDSVPAGWTDCAVDTSIAGVAAGSLDQEGATVIEGSPPILITPADTGFPADLRPAFDQLASQATVGLPAGDWTPGPSINGSDCDVSDSRNWGDPTGPGAPCGDYWPIIHVLGDLRLRSGTGHGILLVDGNLEIDGPFRFDGVVMTLGKLDTDASGGPIDVNGVISSARSGAPGDGLSGIRVTYSKCMLLNSLQTSGTLVPLRSRAWKQLF